MAHMAVATAVAGDPAPARNMTRPQAWIFICKVFNISLNLLEEGDDFH